MSYKLTTEQIEKAVNWWAERINHPTFDGLSQEERRDPANKDYQMGELMASLLVKPTTTSQIDKFKAILREELSSDKYDPWMGLSTDYSPCRELSIAATKAGIPDTNFPWKSMMWFKEDGTVQAACGYRAKPDNL